MNDEIVLKSVNGVGLIKLNRPERLNALTYNIVRQMNSFLDYQRIKKRFLKNLK